MAKSILRGRRRTATNTSTHTQGTSRGFDPASCNGCDTEDLDELEYNEAQKSLKPPRLRQARQNTSSAWATFLHYMFGIFYWELKILNMLILPVGILFGLFIVYIGLDYGSKLAEMQTIGADSVELPYLLQISEGSVRSMIVQLSAVDLPSKERLMPLLKQYRDLADSAIDGLQDTFARIDQGVDATIHINGWASYELGLIEERHSSLVGNVKDFLASGLSLPINAPNTEAEIRQTFISMTDDVQNKLGKVLVDMRIHAETLRQLKDVLDNIAITVIGDHTKLQRERLKEKSYWKWIMRSYRDKMNGFDEKMEICAGFYAHVDQAYQVVSITKFKMQQMRGGLILFRDRLQEAPLYLENGGKGSLQLFIKMLDGQVETLETNKKSTQSLKADKIRKLEASLKAWA